MKTIRAHFKKLPILYRELAIGYALSEEKTAIDKKVKTLSDAILGGFVWRITKEGIVFLGVSCR